MKARSTKEKEDKRQSVNNANGERKIRVKPENENAGKVSVKIEMTNC